MISEISLAFALSVLFLKKLYLEKQEVEEFTVTAPGKKKIDVLSYILNKIRGKLGSKETKTNKKKTDCFLLSHS